MGAKMKEPCTLADGSCKGPDATQTGSSSGQVLETASHAMISRRLCRRTSTAVLTLLDSAETLPWGTRVAEHRLNPPLLSEFEKHLDELFGSTSDTNIVPRALVVHSEGRFWCNGMDLRYIDQQVNAGRADIADDLQRQAERVMGRILTLGVPTLASMPGHCCAAGAMLSLAFDFRVQAGGVKSLFFIPAVELGLRYSPGMLALLSAKLGPAGQRDLMLLGHRFNACTLETELGAGRNAEAVIAAASDEAVKMAAPDFEKSLNLQVLSDQALAAAMYHVEAEKDIFKIKRSSTKFLESAKASVYDDAYVKLMGKGGSTGFASMGWIDRPTKGVEKASKL